MYRWWREREKGKTKDGGKRRKEVFLHREDRVYIVGGNRGRKPWKVVERRSTNM